MDEEFRLSLKLKNISGKEEAKIFSMSEFCNGLDDVRKSRAELFNNLERFLNKIDDKLKKNPQTGVVIYE